MLFARALARCLVSKSDTLSDGNIRLMVLGGQTREDILSHPVQPSMAAGLIEILGMLVIGAAMLLALACLLNPGAPLLINAGAAVLVMLGALVVGLEFQSAQDLACRVPTDAEKEARRTRLTAIFQDFREREVRLLGPGPAA